MEKEKEKNVPQQIVTENLLTLGTPSSGLQPKGLDFTTPRSSTRKKRQPSALLTPSTPETPATPGQYSNISDVESLGSKASSITPEMSKLSLGKSRGRPRKVIEKPSMDDFPFEGSQEEQKHYIAKKNTEMWCYKKLTGANSAEYRRERSREGQNLPTKEEKRSRRN